MAQVVDGALLPRKPLRIVSGNAHAWMFSLLHHLVTPATKQLHMLPIELAEPERLHPLANAIRQQIRERI